MTTDMHAHVSPTANGTYQISAEAEILNSLEAAVIVADADGLIGYRNTTAANWLPDGNDLDSAFRTVRMVDPFPGWHALVSRVLESGDRYEAQGLLAVHHVARPMLVSLTCTPLRTDGSTARRGMLVQVVRRHAEEDVLAKLDVSQRLASLGKLASRVAHELNNPLDGILRYINLAMRAVDETTDTRLQTYLSESRVGLMRMVQIIGDLLEFSRVSDGQFDSMSINAVVDQAIRSTASAADAHRVEVSADFQHPNMPMVSGSRLYQVCCNLIKNAVDVTSEGGRVSISTALVKERVVICVEDTGRGLPDPPERVFEPFFTTKEPGKGTGLGLAICRDFVENLQGTIEASPGKTGGAVFTVSIPVTSFDSPSPCAPTTDTAQRHGIHD